MTDTFGSIHPELLKHLSFWLKGKHQYWNPEILSVSRLDFNLTLTPTLHLSMSSEIKTHESMGGYVLFESQLLTHFNHSKNEHCWSPHENIFFLHEIYSPEMEKLYTSFSPVHKPSIIRPVYLWKAPSFCDNMRLHNGEYVFHVVRNNVILSKWADNKNDISHSLYFCSSGSVGQYINCREALQDRAQAKMKHQL